MPSTVALHRTQCFTLLLASTGVSQEVGRPITLIACPLLSACLARSLRVLPACQTRKTALQLGSTEEAHACSADAPRRIEANVSGHRS